MKNSIVAAALLAGLGFAAAAHADEADPHTLLIKGKVVGQTCEINVAGSDHTVQLKTVRVDQLQANKGMAYQPTKFDIALKNCANIEAGVNTVALNFGTTATSPKDPQGNFKNHGDATNVAVRILDTDGKSQVIAGQDSKPFQINPDGTAKQTYSAAYYTDQGNVTPGTVLADSVIKVSYL